MCGPHDIFFNLFRFSKRTSNLAEPISGRPLPGRSSGERYTLLKVSTDVHWPPLGFVLFVYYWGVGVEGGGVPPAGPNMARWSAVWFRSLMPSVDMSCQYVGVFHWSVC